jgi:hypothetical protein
MKMVLSRYMIDPLPGVEVAEVECFANSADAQTGLFARILASQVSFQRSTFHYKSSK